MIGINKKEKKEKFKDKLKAAAVGAGTAIAARKLIDMHRNSAMDKYNARIYKQGSIANARLQRLGDERNIMNRYKIDPSTANYQNDEDKKFIISRAGINDRKTSDSLKAFQKTLDDRYNSSKNHKLAKSAAIIGGAAAAYGAYKYLQNKRKKKKNIIKRVLHV